MNKPMFFSRLCALSCALLLTACASFVDSDSYQNYYSGKFSARVNASAQSGTYRLLSSKDKLRLTVCGPMGITLAQIESNPSTTRVTVTGQEPFETQDASGFLSHTLGLAIHPLALTQWLEGHPIPDQPYQKLSDSEFIQCGLHIKTVRADTNGKPSLLKLTEQTKQAQLTLTVLREPAP